MLVDRIYTLKDIFVSPRTIGMSQSAQMTGAGGREFSDWKAAVINTHTEYSNFDAYVKYIRNPVKQT